MYARQFEERTADLLRSMNYQDVERVGNTADRGVDVVAYKVDEFGHRSKYIVQCKFYDKVPVSSPDLQIFVGALATHDADRGIFVTSSTFTREAEEIAKLNDITLINGDLFNDLCAQYGIDNISKPKKSKTKRRKHGSKAANATELYNSLSFGSTKGESHDLIFPGITPKEFINGFCTNLIFNYDIPIQDLEVNQAYVNIRGYYAVNWSVDKVWHNSQGRRTKTWKGNGVYVANENGDVVYDVGKSRPTIERSKLVSHINKTPITSISEIREKFDHSYPKVKRIAYKQKIKVRGIPSGDIHCTPRRAYIASEIGIKYTYLGKNGSFTYNYEKGTVTDHQPLFEVSDAKATIVKENPSLETEEMEIIPTETYWEITPQNQDQNTFKVNITNCKIATHPTQKEILIEKARTQAKHIFPDAKYNKDLIFYLNLGPKTYPKWSLGFSSTNGSIWMTSNLNYQFNTTYEINEKYAHEIAQKKNDRGSELVEMRNDDDGFHFEFKDPQYVWSILVNKTGKITLTDKKVTFSEAVNRATNYLRENNVESPTLTSNTRPITVRQYNLNFKSERDGEYEVQVSQNPTRASCKIVNMNITQTRAEYLASKLSKGGPATINKRYWGLAKGWDAFIVYENGKKAKIQIKPNGEIIK